MIIPCGPVNSETRLQTVPGTQRPSFRWPDLWHAPLNDFPIRDEILYQHLPLRPDLDVLEIGPGSGFTAFRLSRHVRSMTLADTVPESVAELRSRLRDILKIRCVCADISKPDLAALLQTDYDVVLGLDVFEYVVDPRTGLSNLAAILRSGGELFLTFPNVPPPRDGVTYFENAEDLEQLLDEAGFSFWAISAVKLRPYASHVYKLFHEMPLRLYRRSRRNNTQERPQTFERAWSFQQRRSLDRYRIPVHFSWLVLAKILRLGGNVFALRPVTGKIFGNQLVIRAWK